MFSKIIYLVLFNLLVFGNSHAVPVDSEVEETEDCPKGQSKFSEEDVTAEVMRIYNKQFRQRVIDSYDPEAQKLANLVVRRVEDIRQSVESRPEHLVRVLKELSDVSKLQIEPVAKHIAEELKKSPELQIKVEEKADQIDESSKVLDKDKELCKLNDCPVKKPVVGVVKRNAPKAKNNFYCSTIKNLREKISSKLDELVTSVVDGTKRSLQIRRSDTWLRINTLERKLNAALPGKLANATSELLLLEDEYVHLKYQLSEVQIDAKMFNLKQFLLDIESKLFKLDHYIEVYGNYCKDCKPNVFKMLLATSVTVQEKSMVERVINEMAPGVWDEASDNIANIMEEAMQLLRSTEDVDNYLKVLDPALENVKNVTDQQRAVLDRLERMVDKESVRKVMSLIRDEIVLIGVLEAEINELKPYQN